MRDKVLRSLSLAMVAAVAVNILVPNIASADGWPKAAPARKMQHRAPARRAAAPAVRERVVERIIEKPVVVEKVVEKLVEVEKPAVVEQAKCLPAVVEQTPVVIDRYEKRHRSLIRLNLFPFSLID